MRRLLGALTAVIVAQVLTGIPVSAHATFLRARPAPDSTVTTSPASVRIWFKADPNEELDPRRSAVSVWGAQGRRVDDGKGGVDLNDLDRLSLIARLKPLAAGTYTVRWRAVSTPDLAIRQGTFRFTVSGGSSLPVLKVVSLWTGPR